jgi:Uma2 family endonuclease
MSTIIPTPGEVDPLFPWPQIELIETDGEPLESDWHRIEINLLIDVVRTHFAERTDFYAGGNMFIYFSEEHARNRDYRGPDFFFVRGVPSAPMRPYWAVWKEGGHYPDVIIELLSPTTAREDRTTKKDLYQNVFRTAEYYCYDPDTKQLEGWGLRGGQYEALAPTDGRLWCGQLNLSLGLWDGVYLGHQATWLRFYTPEGVLVPASAETAQGQARAAEERAEAAAQEAEVQRRRAEAAEAELARLRAQLDPPKRAPDA